MDMYVVKCSEGYLRITPENKYTVVKLQKASVYLDLEELKRLVLHINLNSLTNPRIARLIVTEQDDYVELQYNI